MGLSHLSPLIDADVLQYRCGFAADGQIKKEARLAEPGASDERIMEMLQEVDYTAIALQNVKTVIEEIIHRYEGEPRIYIHDGGNFRNDVATLKVYKGNRSKLKPKYAKEIKEYLAHRWGAILVRDIESDDAIGIAQSMAPPASTIICSNDKDMDMIPGYHFNWVKGDEYFVQDDDADKMLFWQMLVGDSTDNIPGIDKIGIKRATDLLAGLDVEQSRLLVQDKYKKQYGEDWHRYYTEVGTLLWIRRSPEEGCPLL